MSPVEIVAAAVGLIALLLVAMVLLWATRQRAAMTAELGRSRADLEQLSVRMAQLTEEVGRAKQLAESTRDREYLITSVGVPGGSGELLPAEAGRPEPLAPKRSVAVSLEDSLVDALAHRGDQPRRRTTSVRVVVRTVALGHGLRQALSADNRDRIRLEMQREVRRSRRHRRRELKEARRLLREHRGLVGLPGDAA